MVLCYRCPLEEDCKWAKKVFRKIETEYFETEYSYSVEELKTEYLYSIEEREKNCPLKKVLEV